MDTKLNINAIEELSIPVTKLKDPENLTTGFANDLTGRNEATIEEFTLRPSAGNKSIRDDSATIKRIKGNSVVFNQMISTPPVSPYANRCNLSISGNDINATVNSIEYSYVGFYYSLPDDRHPKTVNGHTYFISGLFSCPKRATIAFGVGVSATQQLVPANTLYSYNCIQKQTSDTVGAVFTCWIEDIQVGDTFKVQNWNVIDLTQMFGAGNEPDTVEEFRALFPGNRYEYNPGQLVSMTANGLFTNGFNQWDEEWELGYLNVDGTTAGYVQNYIRAKNYIPVISGVKYYAKLPNGVSDAQLFAVDENYNLIKQIFSWGNNQFFIPDGAAYIRFYLKYGSEVYNNDICINLSHTGVENGKYEPYWDAIKDLSIIQKYFPNGMRSAGSIYDEISFDETTQKWVAIQRVGNVDLGSLTWVDAMNNIFACTEMPNMIVTTDIALRLDGLLCTKYAIDTTPSIDATMSDKTMKRKNGWLYIKDTSFTDVASFKSAMSGIILNYELAEPIITVIEEPINLSYKVGDFGVEQILSDSFSAPFRADIIYQFNATDRIRENSLNIEKLSKTQKECLLLAGGTMSGQINSQDIKPVEDSTYQLGDSTHKYDNVFSNFFTGNLEGNAKTATDLTGRIEATPEVFTYHPSAGEKSIKDDNAFIRRVKGNSVVFNQILVPRNSTETSNGITVTHDGTGKVVVKGTATATTGVAVGTAQIITGHKYVYFGLIGGDANKFYWTDQTASVDTGKGCIAQPTYATGNRYFVLNVLQGITVDFTFYPQVCDLTAMFGVGNEPTTVEEFRALYPNSYYPYNPGELRNLVCSGIKTVGFNLVDKNNFLTGAISSSDTPIQISDFRYIKVPVFPNTKYYLKDVSNMYYYYSYVLYDSNMNRIIASGKVVAGDKPYNISIVITTPSNAAYMIVNVHKDFVDTCCVNLHHTGYRAGDYEPYKEVTHALPLSQITNGEPLRYVYNSYAGEQYDEINETEYIKRIGVVDLGTLDWSWDEGNSVFKTYGLVGNGNAYRFFCSKYTSTNYGFSDMADKTIRSTRENLAVLGIKDSSFGTDASALKASLAGVLLNYELAEPIVTPIETPIDFNYYVEDFGTEEALLTEDSAPFSADIVYQFNATDTIRVLEKNIKQLLNKIISLENTIANAITNSNNL